MPRLRKLTREQIITAARKAVRERSMIICSTNRADVCFNDWPDLVRHLLAVIDGKIGNAP